MPPVEKLSHAEVRQLALLVLDQLIKQWGLVLSVYPIPRGGVPVAYAIAAVAPQRRAVVRIADTPQDAYCCVDDIVDSGATAKRYKESFGKETFALIDKRREVPEGTSPPRYKASWFVFPWEGNTEGSFEDNITRLLQFVGEDPARGGLKETPARVVKAWQQWTAGYNQHASEVLKTFEDGAKKYNEMVVVENIPVYSHCEHHLAPIFGQATVAYIPCERIVGLSKINRLVDIFARRLQVQERMTTQIADALMEHLQPRGCGVLVRARHFCMESRGVKQNSLTTTSALRGVFSDGTVRAEFLSLARAHNGHA